MKKKTKKKNKNWTKKDKNFHSFEWIVEKQMFF